MSLNGLGNLVERVLLIFDCLLHGCLHRVLGLGILVSAGPVGLKQSEHGEVLLELIPDGLRGLRFEFYIRFLALQVRGVLPNRTAQFPVDRLVHVGQIDTKGVRPLFEFGVCQRKQVRVLVCRWMGGMSKYAGTFRLGSGAIEDLRDLQHPRVVKEMLGG